MRIPKVRLGTPSCRLRAGRRLLKVWYRFKAWYRLKVGCMLLMWKESLGPDGLYLYSQQASRLSYLLKINLKNRRTDIL
jgi:hypothetical protein